MDLGDYLAAVGLTPDELPADALERIRVLQRAHVTTIPFANLVIVGTPDGTYDGGPAHLRADDVYRRLVSRGLGGLCYDHNTLFSWALSELGIDHCIAGAEVCADRPDARRQPDTHMTIVADLADGVVADVGFGDIIRAPIPLDGTPVDTVDGTWRAIADGDASYGYTVQFRPPSADDWRDRFRFDRRPRPLSFFHDGFDYHYRDPSAPFGDQAVASIATQSGTRTLSREHLTITEDGGRTKRSVAPAHWLDVLKREFGIVIPPPQDETNSLSRTMENSGHEHD